MPENEIIRELTNQVSIKFVNHSDPKDFIESITVLFRNKGEEKVDLGAEYSDIPADAMDEYRSVFCPDVVVGFGNADGVDAIESAEAMETFLSKGGYKVSRTDEKTLTVIDCNVEGVLRMLVGNNLISENNSFFKNVIEDGVLTYREKEWLSSNNKKSEIEI